MMKYYQPNQMNSHLGPAHLIIIIMLIPFLFSCARHSDIALPPIEPEEQGVYQPGKFVWFELLTEDGDAARQFYSELFGWTFSDSALHKGYDTIVNNDKTIAGMLNISGSDPATQESRWICSISVDDVDNAAKELKSLGGTVLYGPADSGKRGRLAQVADSQGADFILLRTMEGDPGKVKLAPGNPVWADLFTRDKKASETFYTNLFGYKVTKSEEDADHYIFKNGDKLRAGLTPVQWDDLEATWLLFIGVENLRREILKAMSLGATLIVHNETAAVILDPSGAAIGLHLLPEGGQK